MLLNKQEALAAAGKALYGDRWQTDLSKDLGLTDARRIRQWMSGDRNIPDGIWRELEQLLIHRQTAVVEVLDQVIQVKNELPST